MLLALALDLDAHLLSRLVESSRLKTWGLRIGDSKSVPFLLGLLFLPALRKLCTEIFRLTSRC